MKNIIAKVGNKYIDKWAGYDDPLFWWTTAIINELGLLHIKEKGLFEKYLEQNTDFNENDVRDVRHFMWFYGYCCIYDEVWTDDIEKLKEITIYQFDWFINGLKSALRDVGDVESCELDRIALLSVSDEEEAWNIETADIANEEYPPYKYAMDKYICDYLDFNNPLSLEYLKRCYADIKTRQFLNELIENNRDIVEIYDDELKMYIFDYEAWKREYLLRPKTQEEIERELQEKKEKEELHARWEAGIKKLEETGIWDQDLLF